jgi:hypothetical protein
MQTFLPYPDFRQSAAALDNARLGKQRVEALQTLRALVIPGYGWQTHPAIRMWMGYVPALTMYGLAMVDEWTKRGHPDNTRENITEFAPQAAHPDYADKIPMPPWLGDADFHLSHRSKLVRKEPKFYTSVFEDAVPDMDYLWPEPRHEFLPQEPEATFCGSSVRRITTSTPRPWTRWHCRRCMVSPLPRLLRTSRMTATPLCTSRTDPAAPQSSPGRRHPSRS